MAYLAVVQGDDWALGRDDVAREVRKRWPDAEVEIAEDPNGDPARDVVWRYGEGLDAVEGASHSSGQGIYVDGQNAAIAPVVAWYRGPVPNDEEIIFCDDTYSFESTLDPGMTTGDILRLLEPDG